MGKKSRLKRERRKAKAEMDQAIQPYDEVFKAKCNQLRELYARYTAEDVIISLSVSDLWLPNISSQVKHLLGFSIAVGMPIKNFNGSVRIESYSDFKKFIQQVYEFFPDFAMMEDYVPEADWGEVKFPSRDLLLRIFYGGAIERIPDFITSFYLIHSSNHQACSDMHAALAAQDHMLSMIDKSCAGHADDISPGHIEIPSELFWRSCKEAISSFSNQTIFSTMSHELIVKNGTWPGPIKLKDFGEGIFTGKALPFLGVEIGNRIFPLALRNAAGTVIEHWVASDKSPSSLAVADFVSARLNNVITGPFKVASRNELSLFTFSAAILGGSNPYLIIEVDKDDVQNLARLEQDLIRIISSGDWALKLLGPLDAIQIRNIEGYLPSFDQILIIAVILDISTTTGFVKLPKTKVRVIPLSDFISIFDSIEDTEELDNYWAFVDANAGTVRGLSGASDLFASFRDSTYY